jgi:maleylacetoacetate isomerase
MKLHSYWRSSAAYRVRIALNLKQLHAEQLPLGLRSGEQRAPEYLALNPQGLVPTLVVEQGVLTQSLAIIEYLEELQPSPPLLPPDAFGRARVRAMAMVVACDIHPLNNLRVLRYLKASLGASQEAIDEWARHWIAAGLQSLEVLAQQHTSDGKHLYGSSITLADVCLVPQMYNARRLGCELTSYPLLVAVAAALESMPAFVQAAPERQPDADPARAAG